MALASTAGSLALPSSGWQQLQLQKAQREADQAMQNARSLQGRAKEAERVADRAQENARSLRGQSEHALNSAEQAKRGVVGMKSTDQLKIRLSDIYERVAQSQQVQPSRESTETVQAQPVVNSDGQKTGTLISTTA